MAGYKGPDAGSYPESAPAILQIVYAEVRADAARAIVYFADVEIGRQVRSDLQLQAAITELRENGDQSDPVFRSNMRDVVADRIGRFLYHGKQARERFNTFTAEATQVTQELEAMADLEADVSDMPDLWDLSYEKLLASEGSTEE
ncbi:MAG TPA: hypothetical protein VK694_00535 [Verrucomicrobiae bacterium]|nr:hypothetical protein [Verrucomicrobiae bacterium]